MLKLKKNFATKDQSNSTVALFSWHPPKVVHALNIAASKKYPTNILCEEKHIHSYSFVFTVIREAFPVIVTAKILRTCTFFVWQRIQKCYLYAESTSQCGKNFVQVMC